MLFSLLLAHYSHLNGHSELVIERVSKDDAGTYSCVAENRVGSIKSLGFVYVRGAFTVLSYFFRLNITYLTESHAVNVPETIIQSLEKLVIYTMRVRR